MLQVFVEGLLTGSVGRDEIWFLLSTDCSLIERGQEYKYKESKKYKIEHQL
jgi:hypothetical protein